MRTPLNITFISIHCAQEATAILETNFSDVQTVQENEGGKGYGKLRVTDSRPAPARI
jgi:hypothetical protein